jgi:ribosomal protein S18 acetylase RimI-like enzyme
MSTPVIRPGTPADAEACIEIALSAWAPLYDWRRRYLGEALYWAEWPQGVACKREQVGPAFAQHPELTLVTELDGRIVGFATWWFDSGKGFGEIGNNAVHPDFQGRGIGTAQCRRVLDIFREKGVRFARVATGLDDSCASARRQYEKAGFTHQLPTVTYYMEIPGV